MRPYLFGLLIILLGLSLGSFSEAGSSVGPNSRPHKISLASLAPPNPLDPYREPTYWKRKSPLITRKPAFTDSYYADLGQVRSRPADSRNQRVYIGTACQAPNGMVYGGGTPDYASCMDPASASVNGSPTAPARYTETGHGMIMFIPLN